MENLSMKQRKFFATEKTKPYSFRLEQIKKLEKALVDYEDEILVALEKDLGKSIFEGYVTEIGMVKEELKHTKKKLKKWMKPKAVGTPITQFPGRSKVYPEPLGVALIIAPWNYPLQLTLGPVIAAIAAGNCMILKPSEYSPYTSAMVGKIIGELFNEEYIAVVQGDADVTQELLKLKFDYIFFTGSTNVGRIVMEAAAKNLTPVTLELGGKSPCIVDETANIKVAARRIVWGKTLNSGQTCVAPDYLVVHEKVKDQLLAEMKKVLHEFYGEMPLNSKEYPKIITPRHFQRLLKLIEGSSIIFGGNSSEELQKIELTLVDGYDLKQPVMQEEIFGPILPVITFKSLDEVIRLVQHGSKPLALYLFSTNEQNKQKILGTLSFGGGCINDVVVHLTNGNMPFGGVGDSGMGSYHGKNGFDTFSHYKGILTKANFLDIPLRYPPYTGKLKWIKKLM